MILLKFRIKNYKSIEDSGDCYFSDKLTILAGKNESGKTSVLEALADFHENNEIRGEAYRNDDTIPEVSVSFNLSPDEISELIQNAGFSNNLNLNDNTTITLTKFYKKNKDYFLDQESRSKLNLQSRYTEIKNAVLKKLTAIENSLKKNNIKINSPVLQKQLLKDFIVELKTFRDGLLSNAQISQEVVLLITNSIDEIDVLITEYYDNESNTSKFISQFISSKLPYFILFSSFDDKFPQSIPLHEMEDNEWAQDLEEVTSFRIKKFKSASDQERRNHQEYVNAEFSNKFKKYWTQDDIKLQIEKDGDIAKFWIVENGRQFHPHQRSKGQQWYLSFYIKVVANMGESKHNVILIDEPGLYLHAKAQKDLLLILSEHSNRYPVIFSTHSPYLITEDNLENIRLVEKNIQGSKILGKIHAHSKADKETLTPILTAIGLGVNDSITNLDQKDNIVVEGPEDIFYLQAFKLLNNESHPSNFINGGGAPNMGVVGTILEGWGANVYYLFDNDQGKKDGIKNLKKWKVFPDMIKTVLKEDNKTIADILSSEDFKKYVLENSSLKSKLSNSEYIKKNKLEKVLLARKFLQKSKSGLVSLDDISKANIKNLFDVITFKNEI